MLDAISAILAGIVIDRTNMKGGKYRPWLLICPPIVLRLNDQKVEEMEKEIARRTSQL